MFHDVSGKFYVLGQKREEIISISRLIASELRFADYYLDFKHEIIKDIQIDDSLPDIKGIYSHLSMALWMLFRHAMQRMKTEQEKNFYLTAKYDQKHVILSCRFGGDPYTDQEKGLIEGGKGKEGQSEVEAPVDENLLKSVAIMKEMGMIVEASYKEGFNEITVRMAH
jgi:hypothetical protein